MDPIRIVVLLVLTAVAVGVALMLQRRRPDPPSAPSYRAPSQLDRADFVAAPGRWLVVVFGSTTCDTCPVAWATVNEVVAGHRLADRIALQRVDVQTDAALHKRYRIDGVPTVVVADTDGVVVHTFFGPMTSAELTAVLDGPRP